MGHSPWGRRESDTTERLTLLLLNTVQASQVAPVVKNPPARAGDVGSIPGLGRSPGGVWEPTPVFLPGESRGQRRLGGYSLEGHRVGHDRSDSMHAHSHEHS